MEDLPFVVSALMPGRVRNENQFWLPDDFSKIDIAILSWTSHPASVFPPVFHNIDRPLFRDPQFSLHDAGKASEAKSSTIPLSARSRNRQTVRCLQIKVLAAAMWKERLVVVELKAFRAQ